MRKLTPWHIPLFDNLNLDPHRKLIWQLKKLYSVLTEMNEVKEADFFVIMTWTERLTPLTKLLKSTEHLTTYLTIKFPKNMKQYQTSLV